MSDESHIERNEMEPEKLNQLKVILDKWSLCTIGLEDAEKELRKLFRPKGSSSSHVDGQTVYWNGEGVPIYQAGRIVTESFATEQYEHAMLASGKVIDPEFKIYHRVNVFGEFLSSIPVDARLLSHVSPNGQLPYGGWRLDDDKSKFTYDILKSFAGMMIDARHVTNAFKEKTQ